MINRFILLIIFFSFNIKGLETYASKLNHKVNLEDALKKYDPNQLNTGQVLHFQMKEVALLKSDTTSRNTSEVSELWLKGRNLIISNSMFDYWIMDSFIVFYDKDDETAYVYKNTQSLKPENVVMNNMYLKYAPQSKVLELDGTYSQHTYVISSTDSSSEEAPFESTHVVTLNNVIKEIEKIEINIQDEESDVYLRSYTFLNRTIIPESSVHSEWLFTFRNDLASCLKYLTSKGIPIENYLTN